MGERPARLRQAESTQYSRFRQGLAADSQDLRDPGRAFSAQAIEPILDDESSPLAPLLTTFVSLRKECDTPEKLNILHSSLIYFARLDGRDVPQTLDANRENIRRLGELYEKALSDTATPEEEDRYKKVAWALVGRELNTTTASRYGTTEHMAQVASERFPGGALIADIGSSTGVGLKVMSLKQQFGQAAFPHVDILGSRGRVHKRWTAAFNEVLSRPTQLRQALAIDIEDPHDPDTQLWAESNLRHKEQANEHFMRMYRWLMQEQPDNVLFKHVDFTDKNNIEGFVEEVGAGKIDLAIYNTSFYQMARVQQRTALEPLPQMLSPNGIALLQDAVRVTGPGLFDVEINPASWSDRKRLPWTTLAYDNANPENGWQPLFHSEDSRFRRIVLGSGTLAVHGTQQTPAEWLNAASSPARPSVHLPAPRIPS